MTPQLREMLHEDRETVLLWSGHLRSLNPEAPAIWRRRQWLSVLLDILLALVLLGAFPLFILLLGALK